jgi:hypothetical protein
MAYARRPAKMVLVLRSVRALLDGRVRHVICVRMGSLGRPVLVCLHHISFVVADLVACAADCSECDDGLFGSGSCLGTPSTSLDSKPPTPRPARIVHILMIQRATVFMAHVDHPVAARVLQDGLAAPPHQLCALHAPLASSLHPMETVWVCYLPHIGRVRLLSLTPLSVPSRLLYLLACARFEDDGHLHFLPVWPGPR